MCTGNLVVDSFTMAIYEVPNVDTIDSTVKELTFTVGFIHSNFKIISSLLNLVKSQL